MDDYSGIERRRFKRVKVSFIVFYKADSPMHVWMMVGEKEVHAIMLDLSEGGMALMSNYNIPVDTLLSIRFILINENVVEDDLQVRPMQIKGKVQYNVPEGKGDYRLGISFTNILEEDRSVVAKFVETARF